MMLEPVASRSRTNILFSRSRAGSSAHRDEDGDWLLLGKWLGCGCNRDEADGEEDDGTGGGDEERASRHASVRRVGSSSEKM